MSKRALSDEGGCSPKTKRAAKETKPLDPKKFGGKTEEEVCQMLLPDHLAPSLDIIFVSRVASERHRKGEGVGGWYINEYGISQRQYILSFFQHYANTLSTGSTYRWVSTPASTQLTSGITTATPTTTSVSHFQVVFWKGTDIQPSLKIIWAKPFEFFSLCFNEKHYHQ